VIWEPSWRCFVGRVCLRSKIFFSALFPLINFFAWSRLFKELQIKGNLFDCPQVWTVARLTYRKQTNVCGLFISKYSFSESDFCRITSHSFNPISKIFCNFLLQLNMAKRRHAFLVLFVLKWREKINWRKPKFALTCSFQKVIMTFALSGREKNQ